MRGMTRYLVGAVLVAGLAACGSDDDAGQASSPPATTADAVDATPPTGGGDTVGTDPTPSTPTDAPPGQAPPPTDPGTESDGSAAEELFREGLATCNEQSQRDLGDEAFDGGPDDPTVGITFDDEIAPGVFRIEDARGIVLLVDLNSRQITGPDGPDGILPRDYLFVCPETYFVGRFDEEGLLDDEEAFNEADGFYRSALAACNVYSADVNGFEPFDGSEDDPTLGVSPRDEVSPGVWNVVDNDGVELLIDMNDRVVTGPDGPDGVMPRPYAFWCPPEVFPGTLDEGEEGDVEGDPLFLQPDGLGIVFFGTAPDAAITTVSDTLGPPDADTGWIDSDSPWDVCPGDEIRVVRWWNLEVLFTDVAETPSTAGDGPHFFNWRLPDLDGEGTALDFTTRGGIGLGSTVETLEATYGGNVEIDFNPDEGQWEFYVTGGEDDGILGVVSDPDPTGTVTDMQAGAVCFVGIS